MNVIWGSRDDEPLVLVHEALQDRNAPVVFIDQDSTGHCAWVPGTDPCDAQLLVDGLCLSTGDITAMYLRPELPQGEAPGGQHARFIHAVCAWADVAPATMLNRPGAMWSNHSKPLQSLVAAQVGFSVPPTLITTDAEAARAFVAEHGRVIYKSISSVRSIVKELDPDDDRLSAAFGAPVQLQRCIQGIDHRVHVVGDRLFACSIRSDSSDYRYDGDSEKHSCTLPDDVAERCLALARTLGLTFTGIDLRRTPDDEWFCFEANPSPGFSYYERATGAPIAAAVADLMVAARNG